METTLTAPVWIIQGNSDIHGSREAGKQVICDRCGANLFAEVWYIKNTTTGQVSGVGAGCVKTLTGSSISKLRQEQDGYEAGMAADADRAWKLRQRIAWAELNALELAFVDEHIARIQDAQTRWHAENPNPGIGSGQPPSAEFYERLRNKAQTVGVWTEGELQAVRREMSLDHEAALPAKKSRDIYEGTIERVCVEAGGWGRAVSWKSTLTLRWKSTLTLRSADGKLLYFVKAGENTTLEDELFKLARYAGWDGNFYTGRDADSAQAKRESAFNRLRGMKLRFKGTVKGSAMTGGKVYFTRAVLEPATKEA